MNKTGNKTQNGSDNFLLNKWTYIISTIVFILGFSILFLWKRSFFLWNYQTDNSLLGTFGDFVGGVLGTIFMMISVLLVIKTFKHQQKVTNDNKKQLEEQRFNDLFFELLRLYQEEIKDLCGEITRIRPISKDDNVEASEKVNNTVKVEESTIEYNNKDFFNFEKRKMQHNYRNEKSFEKNKDRAVKYYMIFYINNQGKISAYYRTLYRIYDLIDNSSISENSKKNYLKIIRSQLTESELFFIRYNAMTYYGNNFIKYLNKYHVLKHLPAFELLEFKDWWKDLNELEKNGINILFDYLNRTIRKSFEKEQYQIIKLFEDRQSKHKFCIKINYYDVLITITINNKSKNGSMELLGLSKFDDKRIQQLLDFFIKEIFIYSNFCQFNQTDVETYSDPIVITQEERIINSGIRNTQNNPLVLCPSPK